MKLLRWELVKEDIVPTVDYQCIGLTAKKERCIRFAYWAFDPKMLPFRCHQHTVRKEDK